MQLTLYQVQWDFLSNGYNGEYDEVKCELLKSYINDNRIIFVEGRLYELTEKSEVKGDSSN